MTNRTNNPDTGRSRARVRYPNLGPCEKCKKKQATDRHHRDGDTFNNDRANIEFLCRRCHMVEDGRLQALIELPRPPWATERPCVNCGNLVKVLRRGRCHRCNESLRRNGVEWVPDNDRRFGKRAPEHFCNNCKRRVETGWSKGRCPACRLYFAAHGKERPMKENKCRERESMLTNL